MDKPEGGWVFPVGYHRDGNSADQIGGLTVRQLFAGMAMIGILASPASEPCEGFGSVAERAFMQADAMVREAGLGDVQ